MLRGSALELLSPDASFLPPSPSGSSERTSCPVGGPSWPLGHKGPPSCSLHTCSQSEQRHRARGLCQAGPSLPSPRHCHQAEVAPSPAWVPASPASGSPTPMRTLGLSFWREPSGEQRRPFLFLVGEVRCSAGRRAGGARGLLAAGEEALSSGLGIKFETERCHETPGSCRCVPGCRWGTAW